MKTKKLSYKQWSETKEVKAQFPNIPGYIIAECLARGVNPAEERQDAMKAAFDEYDPEGIPFRKAQAEQAEARAAAERAALEKPAKHGKSSKVSV